MASVSRSAVYTGGFNAINYVCIFIISIGTCISVNCKISRLLKRTHQLLHELDVPAGISEPIP